MFFRDDNKASDEDVHNQDNNMVQQLNQELSLKGMVFSKNCIQLSKVVGQGRLRSTSQKLILHACSIVQESQDWCTVVTLTVEVAEIW